MPQRKRDVSKEEWEKAEREGRTYWQIQVPVYFALWILGLIVLTVAAVVLAVLAQPM